MEIEIGLDAWIIQDGNYPDFKKGEVREFALEFSPIKLHRTNQSGIYVYESLGEGRYKIDGKVVYLNTRTHACINVSGTGKDRVETKGEYDETVVVLDLGDIMVFDESNLDCYEKDGFVEGEIWIGVDPFFYKEGHCKLPGIPALTYSWKIEKVELLMAPWVEAVEMWHGKERKVHRRDETKISYKEIEQTNAWKDDDFTASYVLTVSKP